MSKRPIAAIGAGLITGERGDVFRRQHSVVKDSITDSVHIRHTVANAEGLGAEMRHAGDIRPLSQAQIAKDST